MRQSLRFVTDRIEGGFKSIFRREAAAQAAPAAADRYSSISEQSAGPSLFAQLQSGKIAVLRQVPEILELRNTVLRIVAQRQGAERAADVAQMMQQGEVSDLETFAAFYNAVRHLRDSRYISSLMSDWIGRFGLPKPLLLDSGFCRMVVPGLWEEAYKRRDLFQMEGERQDNTPNDAEAIVQHAFWGNAHRDLDVRHYHYQANLWFPLHDLPQDHSLVLFPDAYRRNLPQYVKLADPDLEDEWGYGPAVQVPLRLGDTLLFHSQHMHASPALPPTRNRFTVELRIAAGCIDDNATIYRRLFWNVSNFEAAVGDNSSSTERAALLAELPKQGSEVETALAATSAHAVLHSLFRSPAVHLAAAYIHRDDRTLDGAITLSHDDAGRVLAKLSAMPAGEDLWHLFARLLWRQRHQDLALGAMQHLSEMTVSYFWALEAGRLLAEARRYDLARAAFERAYLLADQSLVALDRFTPDMPPARSGDHVPQLLPDAAKAAAAALGKRAAKEENGMPARTRTFDLRIFAAHGNNAIESYEHYDLIWVGGMIVALPAGRAFSPEGILDANGDVVLAETVDAAKAALGDRLGPLVAARHIPVALAA